MENLAYGLAFVLVFVCMFAVLGVLETRRVFYLVVAVITAGAYLALLALAQALSVWFLLPLLIASVLVRHRVVGHLESEIGFEKAERYLARRYIAWRERDR